MRFSSFVVVIGLTILLTSGCAMRKASRFAEPHVCDANCDPQRDAFQTCRQSRTAAGLCDCYTCVSKEVNAQLIRQTARRRPQRQVLSQSDFEINEPVPYRSTQIRRASASRGNHVASRVSSSRIQATGPEDGPDEPIDIAQRVAELRSKISDKSVESKTLINESAAAEETSQPELPKPATDLAVNALGINSLSSTLALTEDESSQPEAFSESAALEIANEFDQLEAMNESAPLVMSEQLPSDSMQKELADRLQLDLALESASPETAEQLLLPEAPAAAPQISQSEPEIAPESPAAAPNLVASERSPAPEVNRNADSNQLPIDQSFDLSEAELNEIETPAAQPLQMQADQSLVAPAETEVTVPKPELAVTTKKPTPVVPARDDKSELAITTEEPSPIVPARDDATRIADAPVAAKQTLVLKARTSSYDEAVGESNFLQAITRGATAKKQPMSTSYSETPNSLNNDETVYFSPLPAVEYPRYREPLRYAQPVRYTQPLQQSLQQPQRLSATTSGGSQATINQHPVPGQPAIKMQATQLQARGNLVPIRKPNSKTNGSQRLMIQASSPKAYDIHSPSLAASRILQESRSTAQGFRTNPNTIRLRATAGSDRDEKLPPVIDLRFTNPTQSAGDLAPSTMDSSNAPNRSPNARSRSHEPGASNFQTPRTPVDPNAVPSIQNIPKLDLQQIDPRIRHLTIRPDDQPKSSTIDR